MKIQVSLPRNTNDQAKKWVLEDATKFFAKKLMGTRLANLLKIKVQVRKTTLDPLTKGQVIMVASGSIRQREYVITLDHARGLHGNLETLAHEMVHVRQKAKDELQYRYNYGKIMARWKDNAVVPLNEIPYVDRPWEIEARSLQKGLYKDYLDHVKVKYAKTEEEK